MATNPDHPAHRDQLLSDVAALHLATKGVEITSEELMQFRLRDPRRTEDQKPMAQGEIDGLVSIMRLQQPDSDKHRLAAAESERMSYGIGMSPPRKDFPRLVVPS